MTPDSVRQFILSPFRKQNNNWLYMPAWDERAYTYLDRRFESSRYRHMVLSSIPEEEPNWSSDITMRCLNKTHPIDLPKVSTEVNLRVVNEESSSLTSFGTRWHFPSCNKLEALHDRLNDYQSHANRMIPCTEPGSAHTKTFLNHNHQNIKISG